jgi:beta-exotoxin I transport system ATP-binding protein
MSNVIETHALTRSYGSRRGVMDVELAVAEGEAFGFLGPNGAGKTTTIRLLAGSIRPTSGWARVFGLDTWSRAPDVHGDMALLPSDPGYLPELTAGEQLDYLCALRGLTRGSWRRLCERLELDPTVRIGKLSRGNRQKVAVVQVFMGHERLLVMDEPTTGLDPLMQREFLSLLAEARADGRTVFLSSHNLPEVERGCDRVAIIREGRVVDVSPVQALLGEHWRSVNLVVDGPVPPGTFDLPNVRVLAAGARDVHVMARGDVNPLLRRIAGLEVRDIAITTPDIEDVFMRFYDRSEPEGEAAAERVAVPGAGPAVDVAPVPPAERVAGSEAEHATAAGEATR